MKYFCPECRGELKLEADGDLYCDNCEVYFDPGIVKFNGICRPGPGCTACGNPVFPKCIDSCPLMSD